MSDPYALLTLREMVTGNPKTKKFSFPITSDQIQFLGSINRSVCHLMGEETDWRLYFETTNHKRNDPMIQHFCDLRTFMIKDISILFPEKYEE